MESSKVQQAIQRAIAEAALACDPSQNGLMDRDDLQRTISRLKKTLEQISYLCENLHDQQDLLTARLTRNHFKRDWMGADHGATA